MQPEDVTFANYGLIRMGDARVDAVDDFAGRTNDFAARTRHLHKLVGTGGYWWVLVGTGGYWWVPAGTDEYQVLVGISG